MSACSYECILQEQFVGSAVSPVPVDIKVLPLKVPPGEPEPALAQVGVLGRLPLEPHLRPLRDRRRRRVGRAQQFPRHPQSLMRPSEKTPELESDPSLKLQNLSSGFVLVIFPGLLADGQEMALSRLVLVLFMRYYS